MSPLDPRARAMQGALRGLPQVPNLADIFGGQPRPVAVSPASPAPMQPGVDILPPQAARDTGAAMGDAAAAEAARTAEERFGELYARMREKSQAELRRAEQEATIDPEQEAVFAGERARLDERRGEVDREKKLRDWDALANMGFTMARSDSPFFAQALAEGLQAGSRGLSESRMARARDRALLKDREDQIAQARYKALKSARDEARQRLVQGADLTEKEVKTAAMTEEAIVKKATSQPAIRKALADAEGAEFEAANAGRVLEAELGLRGAQTAAAQANAAESYAGAEAYRTGQRGGRGGYDIKDVDRATDDFHMAVADANKARNTWQMPGIRRTEKTEAYNDVLAAQEKALIAANRMRRIKGQPPITLRQLFPVNNAAQRAVGAATPAAPADPLGIR